MPDTRTTGSSCSARCDRTTARRSSATTSSARPSDARPVETRRARRFAPGSGSSASSRSSGSTNPCPSGACRCASKETSSPCWCGSRALFGARASLFEQQYLSVFVRLCDMVSDATFPYREDSVAGPGLPRVGDGVILMDELGRVEFATPNAVNALHRLGIYTAAEGHSLERGRRAGACHRALAGVRHSLARRGRPGPRRGHSLSRRAAHRPSAR